MIVGSRACGDEGPYDLEQLLRPQGNKGGRIACGRWAWSSREASIRIVA